MMKFPNIKYEINTSQVSTTFRQCMAFSSTKISLSTATWLQPFTVLYRSEGTLYKLFSCNPVVAVLLFGW